MMSFESNLFAWRNRGLRHHKVRPALGLEVQALESKEKIWQTEETILPVGQDYKYYVFSSLVLKY